MLGAALVALVVLEETGHLEARGEGRAEGGGEADPEGWEAWKGVVAGGGGATEFWVGAGATFSAAEAEAVATLSVGAEAALEVEAKANLWEGGETLLVLGAGQIWWPGPELAVLCSTAG